MHTGKFNGAELTSVFMPNILKKAIVRITGDLIFETGSETLAKLLVHK